MAYTYEGTAISVRSTTPSVYKATGIASARVGQTYHNTLNGNVYECTKAGDASHARWAYVRTDHTFRGTGITGTKDTARAFPNSGVKRAVAGNTYLNTNTGHVYVCDTAGDAAHAKWAYSRTEVIGRPDSGVRSLTAPARGKNGSHRVSSTWKVPDGLVSEKSGRRASALAVTWRLLTPRKEPLPKGDTCQLTLGTSAKSSSVNLDGFTADRGTYTRDTFHPVGGVRLLGASVTVRPTNAKGNGTEPASATLRFEKPRKPSISAVTFDGETGELSAKITTNPGDDRYERHDTLYSFSVYNSTQKDWSNKGYAVRLENVADTATTITCKRDAGAYADLGADGYIRFRVRARARGYAGDSEDVERTYYLAYPKRATISAVNVDDSSGRAVVRLSTNKSESHPVRVVRLYILANVPYAKPSQIPADASWVESDAIDDGECTALACPVSDLQAEPGNRTWVKVVSWAEDDTVLHTDSLPYRVDDMYSPAASAADDYVRILECVSGTDGRSVRVLVGWGRDGHVDDATGTEIAWSGDEDAWISSDEPESRQTEIDDGPITYDGHSYQGSATFVIKRLTEGETVWVRARRYLEGDATTYGRWTNPSKAVPAVAPSDVTLVAPPSVAHGADIPLSWTFGGGGTQVAYQLLAGSTVLRMANGSAGGYSLPYSRYADHVADGAITLSVTVGTGSRKAPNYASSPAVSVIVTEPPTLSVTLGDTIAAQPITFAASSSETGELVARLVSDGNEGATPTGLDAQPAGDTAWSGVLSPEWEQAQDGTWTCEASLPDGLALVDGGGYTLHVTARDPASGLSSGEVTAQATVAWAHQAPVPDATCVDVEPMDYVDGEGTHHQSVAVTLSPKASAEATAGGVAVTLSDVAPVPLASLAVHGATEQDGDPTPGAPVAIESAAPAAIVVTAPDGTATEVALPTDGVELRRLPTGIEDVLLVDSGGVVTLTARTASTTQAATIGVTGVVGSDLLSTTGEIADGATVVYALGEPEVTTLGTVDMPVVSEGCVVSVESVVPATVDAAWMTAPTVAGDSWEVYRVTGDGPRLIGDRYPLDAALTDEHAPYGTGMDLSYRVACRTADGDVAWADFDYALPGTALRVDWAEGSVELPYDIAIADSYAKGKEVHAYLDGESDAYYDAGVTRTAKLSTDLVRLEDQAEVRLVRALARYPGNAFVRTPDGSAYEACVEVTDMSTDGSMQDVALDATEVRLTAAYMLPPLGTEVGP